MQIEDIIMHCTDVRMLKSPETFILKEVLTSKSTWTRVTSKSTWTIYYMKYKCTLNKHWQFNMFHFSAKSEKTKVNVTQNLWHDYKMLEFNLKLVLTSCK